MEDQWEAGLGTENTFEYCSDQARLKLSTPQLINEKYHAGDV